MWFLAIIILLQMTANNKTFFLENRLTIAGLPLNVFDGLTLLGLLMMVLPISRNRDVPEQIHPAFVWLLVIFTLSGLLGTLVSVVSGTWEYQLIAATRNWMCIPLGVLLGYRFVSSLKSAKWLAYICLLGSIISAILVLAFVHDTTGEMTQSRSWDILRDTSIGGDSGVSGAALILFSLTADLLILPRAISLMALVICVCGWFLLPHRAGWLAASATSLFAMFFLSAYRPTRKLLIGIAMLVLLTFVFVGAVAVMSKTTGKDYGSWVRTRLESMIPGSDTHAHAWDTRMPGIQRELALFVRSPLWGNGFGIALQDALESGTNFFSYHHNTWTAIMSETGLIGLSGGVLLTLGAIVIGRRMVREEHDWGSVLFGAYGAIVACSYFCFGFLTLSFNTQRHGLFLGLIVGMLLRTRALQLGEKRLQQMQVTMPMPHYEGEMIPNLGY